METDKNIALNQGDIPLKPSLVEWKLARSDRADMSSVALKPSLVEWKLRGDRIAQLLIVPP